METFGYPGMAILILVENIFPPIPSEIILTFGGFMTTQSDLSVPGVIISATIGSVLGAIMLYYIGLLIPAERLEKIADGRAGKILHLNKADIRKAVGWFDKRGNMTVFICRCIPIVRSLISIPAGMAKMEMGRFVLLTTLGSALWNTILVSAGAAAGASWGKIVQMMNAYSELTYSILMIALAFFIWRWCKKRKMKLQ